MQLFHLVREIAGSRNTWTREVAVCVRLNNGRVVSVEENTPLGELLDGQVDKFSHETRRERSGSNRKQQYRGKKVGEMHKPQMPRFKAALRPPPPPPPAPPVSNVTDKHKRVNQDNRHNVGRVEERLREIRGRSASMDTRRTGQRDRITSSGTEMAARVGTQRPDKQRRTESGGSLPDLGRPKTK